MRRARKLWNVRCDPDAVDWGAVLLAEPDYRREVIEDDAQEAKLRDALDEDTRDIFAFSLLTGVRAENAYGLRKAQVNWTAARIEFWVKSKKRNRRTGDSGKLKIVPITTAIEAILRRCWEQHPEHVFTYVCRKSRSWVDPETGERHIHRKGMRYPFTGSLLRDRWFEARDKAGLPKLKWHGLRATFATQRHREGTDLATVKELMGHADISTTMRYIVVTEEGQRAALLRAENLRAARLAQGGHKSARATLKVVK
jgi:integrase